MELKIEQKQGLALSPQLLQSMQMLQMTAGELAEFLSAALDENPVLERDEKAERLLREAFAEKTRSLPRPQMETPELPAPVDGLRASLSEQLPMGDGAVYKCAKYLIYALDEDGYLDGDTESFLAGRGVPPEVFASALTAVQAMEPAGVGARSLSECLCLQLSRRGQRGLPYLAAESCLEDVGACRYGVIARRFGVTRSEAEAACQVIRGLNPRPGAAFSGGTAGYVSPDVAVMPTGDGFETVLNDGRFPAVRVARAYADALREDAGREVRDYVSERLAQARWVARGMEKRSGALLACAGSIAERQREFFEKGPGHLAPMTLADVAGDMGVHPSTVSRAIRGKYLQCRWGSLPMSAFFARDVGGASRDRAKGLIRRFLAEEEKSRPLSDMELSRRLKNEGVDISRRTVAKYRAEMGLRPSPGRRKSK